MNFSIARSYVLINHVSTERGRSYVHTEKSSTTRDDGSVERVLETKIVVRDPIEAKKVQVLYSKAYNAFKGLGYPLGRQVYLIAANDKDKVDKLISDLAKEIQDTNLTFNVCHIDFRPRVAEIVPEKASEETLESLRKDISDAINDLLEALKGGDLKIIKAAISSSRNIEKLLDGEAKKEASGLSVLAKDIADRLKKANEEGEKAVEMVQEKAKTGALRFALVLSEMGFDVPFPQPE